MFSEMEYKGHRTYFGYFAKQTQKAKYKLPHLSFRPSLTIQRREFHWKGLCENAVVSFLTKFAGTFQFWLVSDTLPTDYTTCNWSSQWRHYILCEELVKAKTTVNLRIKTGWHYTANNIMFRNLKQNALSLPAHFWINTITSLKHTLRCMALWVDCSLF
jgi:hypothetical protein